MTVLFIILGVIVLITFVVLGFLFFMLGKEGKKKDENIVPLTDISQIKRELSSNLLEPQIPTTKEVPEIIAAFSPAVSLPTGESKPSADEGIYKKRALHLEEELLDISKKAEGQSEEARQMIESLMKENDSLKIQQTNLIQAQQKLLELETQAEGLHTENTTLQTQLDSTNAKVRLLEEEMIVVKIQMGEEIKQANATVSQLTIEKESLLSAAQNAPDDALHQELEALKAQQIQLKQHYEEIEKANLKLRDLNVSLIEKNDLLQLELVKAKAQSNGLERIGLNYKTQLEDLLNKINAVELKNEELTQDKNRIEREFQDFKASVQPKDAL